MAVSGFLFFSLLTAVLFWRWLPELNHVLLGPPEDNLQDFWNSWYAALADRADGFFHTNLIRFPEGTSLYYHSFSYVQLFFVWILNALFNPSHAIDRLLFIHNLMLLASFPLAAMGAFYLTRHCTGNLAAAWVAGFVFAFNPSHVEQVMHHAHVASIEFIPFFVLCYLQAVQRRRPGWIVAAVLCNTLSALSCWYYLFYDGYFIIFHSLYLLLRDRRRPAVGDAVIPLAVLAGTSLLLLPWLIPMVRDALSNPAVYAGGTDACVADLAAYLLFPPLHLLSRLTQPLYARLTGNEWEDTVYLGLGNLLLLAWLGLKRPRSVLPYALCGMAFFCVIASGDSLHLLGQRLIEMPGALLSRLPFVRNIRTPSRAIVYVYLFLAIGAGGGFALLWQQRRLRWACMAILALLLADFYPAGLTATPLACGSGWEVIRDDKETGFGVLDLPNLDMTSFPSYVANNAYMAEQVCHGRPIAQGMTSRLVSLSLRDRLETADLDRQRQQLTAAQIKYIVISKPRGGAYIWQGTDMFQSPPGQPDYGRHYKQVYDGPERAIFEVY